MFISLLFSVSFIILVGPKIVKNLQYLIIFRTCNIVFVFLVTVFKIISIYLIRSYRIRDGGLKCRFYRNKRKNAPQTAKLKLREP